MYFIFSNVRHYIIKEAYIYDHSSSPCVITYFSFFSPFLTALTVGDFVLFEIIFFSDSSHYPPE